MRRLAACMLIVLTLFAILNRLQCCRTGVGNICSGRRSSLLQCRASCTCSRSGCVRVVCAIRALCVFVSSIGRFTKRRSGWACIGNQSETRAGTVEGTHARETPAHQRRPTTLHEVQGKQPPDQGNIHAARKDTTHITPHRVPCYKETQ